MLYIRMESALENMNVIVCFFDEPIGMKNIGIIKNGLPEVVFFSKM